MGETDVQPVFYTFIWPPSTQWIAAFCPMIIVARYPYIYFYHILINAPDCKKHILRSLYFNRRIPLTRITVESTIDNLDENSGVKENVYDHEFNSEGSHFLLYPAYSNLVVRMM